jgi:hypothetical protein
MTFKEMQHNYYFISQVTVTRFSVARCRFRPGRTETSRTQITAWNIFSEPTLNFYYIYSLRLKYVSMTYVQTFRII